MCATPNGRFQPPLKTGATQERALKAVGCKPWFGNATGGLALRLFDEARLNKVLIKGKGLLDAQFLHDNLHFADF
jgi:hypothetical protein